MKRLRSLFDIRFWKFLLVGIVNTIVGMAIMFGLYNLAGMGYWFSSVANYVVGSIVSFFLNKYFTFQNKGWSWNQVWKFAVSVGACYIIAYGVAKPLTICFLAGQSIKIQENTAMLVGMCLYTGLNYLGQRFFAFRQG